MRLYQVWCLGPHGFRSRIGEPQPRATALEWTRRGFCGFDFPHTIMRTGPRGQGWRDIYQWVVEEEEE